jgi:hypothetical protein
VNPTRIKGGKGAPAASGFVAILHRDPQLDPIVRRVDQILLRAQVPLRRLDLGMAQEQLNLFEFSSGGAT